MKKKIYIVDESQLNDDQIALFTSIQGLVNTKNKELILKVDNYLRFIDLGKYEVEEISFDKCILKYIPLFKNYITYTLSNKSTEINAAFSYSAATGALAVPHKLENLVKGKLTLLEDLSELKLDNLEIQKYVFNKFKKKFRKDGMVHQPLQQEGKFLISIRDFAIPNKWLVLYLNEEKEQRKFLDEVLSFLNKGIAIYGWTSDEISFVDQISKYGDAVVPMDWSSNHSFFMMSKSKKYERRLERIEVKENNHYVTLVVSDGDNIQWLERDYCFTSFYGDFAKEKRNYPLTISISPALVKLNPSCLKYIYDSITNEDVISGVSGYGYMNPMVFPIDHLKQYVNKTAKYLNYCSINVNMMLDNLNNITDEKVNTVLGEYTKHKNIKGCIYELDPTKYEGGKGIIYWANNKPIMSVKYSLWFDEFGEKERESLVDQIANAINSSSTDKTNPDCYSVVNIHPWSARMKDVDNLVSKLNDNVQILGVEQFIELASKNILR